MPDWTEHLRPRLARLRLDPAREAEIIEELSQHLDQRYEELRSGGASDAEALRLSIEELREPGFLAAHMRSLRQARAAKPIRPGSPPGGSLLADLRQDLRYAIRTLGKQPGFTAAAVLTLALGIGANSAMFALVDATLLRPLPFPDPERLVKVWESSETTARGSVAPSNLADWSERTRTFEALGGYLNVASMVMGGSDGTAETVSRQWVTAGIFDALGVEAIVGRAFLPSDDEQRAAVVVLSEGFWRTRFAADPDVVGRDIRLDGAPYTVVGVVPEEAQLIGRTSIWALVSIQDLPAGARSAYIFDVVGRLRAGVTREVASADMAAVAAALAQAFPDTNEGRGVTLAPLRDVVIGTELRQTSVLFLGVVAFVLLICCANVANLLLTRATVRRRDLAVMTALGADRRRVIRQLLTESLVLATIGGVLGVLVGVAILRAAPAAVPPGLLPATVTLAFDLRVGAFCAGAALLVGLLFGLAPAFRATGFAPAQAIAAEGRAVTNRGGHLRSLLVVGQVATAVVLLFGAGLLLRTLMVLAKVDRGYGADSALTMMVDPLGSEYPTGEVLRQFYDDVEREVTALPGVRGAAWATTLPLGPSYQGEVFFEVAGETAARDSQRPAADYQVVSLDYFRTLDLPLVAGRGFDERDAPDSIPVCIVNEAFVRAYLQGRSPIGARVAIRSTETAQEPAAVREIVGVARQVKGRADETEDLVQIYVPMAQDTPGDIYLLVRPASGPATALTPAVRAAIGRVDKQQLVSVRDVTTLDEVASAGTSRHRFRAVLVTAFAALALLLAMAGLFGILAYTVQQRVRDFGVRRALGASTGDVLRLVVANAVRVIGTGAVIGLALSTLLGQLLATMLFGVQPFDAVTYASVTVVLVLTAVLSIAAPAWRATRVDPAVALRTE